MGLYKLNPVDPQLESAWFQPLKLKCDFLVSNFAVKLNLYRYTTVGVVGGESSATGIVDPRRGCTLITGSPRGAVGPL